MENQVTIKRSPFILIRTFIAIELAAFLAYYLVTGRGSYKSDIYNQIPLLSDLISYDTAKLLFLAGAQLFITVYAFARWYSESYSVRPGSLSHRWGVLFKKNRIVPLDRSMAMTVSSGPLGKRLHYGSIRIEGGPSYASLTLADVSRQTEFIEALEQCINPQSHGFMEPDVARLLKAEEHERLEFKTSLRFDHKSGNVNRELERAAMKTVAAFLNTKGGELVIGVNDRREPVGILRDLQTVQRPDSDGFENHFTQVFNSMIGPEFRHLVKLWFHEHGNAPLCIIQVMPSAWPIYLKVDDSEHFYVRTGNITTALKLSEVESYRRSHWPGRAAPSA
ncbi:MAG: RNA-binding domain-containing protein [Candidatus Jorgensenbacteria bacterium]